MKQKISLTEYDPRIASQWHPTKNGDLTPDQVTFGSGKKVWWFCEKGHEWQAMVTSRTSGTGCPVCANRKVLVGYNDLASQNPALAAEWHPIKNGELAPSQVAFGSGKKVWWLGPCGHEWEATIASRASGTGCPCCSGRYAIHGETDLATVNPALATEWHPTKNNSLTPEMVTSGSSKKVWWFGACGHEWEATIASRASGTGCPICSNRLILSGYNDLASQNPALAAEWHPTKNGELTPSQVNLSSGKKVWWLGPCGHEWEATIADRNKGTDCPICSNRLILLGYNDLASQNPALAAEWHPIKNGELTPSQVNLGSGKKVWWLGPCGHEWEARVDNRTNLKSGCPYCSKTNAKALEGYNDLTTTHPEIAKQWHPTQNGELSPDQVTSSSNKKVWWLCEKGHEWEATIAKRTRYGRSCPYCSGRYAIHGETDLATVNPALATEWHPTKNKGLTPMQVTKGSRKKIWWQCKEGHEWEARIASRSKGCGCPYCKNEKIASKRTSTILHKNGSMIDKYPELVAQWHPTKNKNLIIERMTPKNSAKVWWLCEKGHEWKATVADRANGRGCPYCSNKKVLSGFNDLASVNPKIAAEWHPTKNNSLTPEMLTSGSSKKAWWLCEKGHEWRATVANRTRGTGCPVCANQKVLVGYNDLASQNPALAAEWHPTKNGVLRPEQIVVGSSKKVWWICHSCGYEWENMVIGRTHGNQCPKCKTKIIK